jgi:hypothetical protein
VADPSNRTQAITLEVNALVAQQNKAVKDATFGGWGAEEKAAYDERGKRITTLRGELFQLGGTEPRLI